MPDQADALKAALRVSDWQDVDQFKERAIVKKAQKVRGIFE